MENKPTTVTTVNGFHDDTPILERKRFTLAVIVLGLWVALGILGIIFLTHFYDLSVYFISLTGFVGAYIISETKRPSISTSIFKKGRSSKRELIIYVTILLWTILGVVGIIKDIDMIEAAAYFSALTPYISTYLIGSAYKPDLPKSLREQEYNNNMNNMYGGGGGYWNSYGSYGNVSGYNGAPIPPNQQIVDVVSKPNDVHDP